jgi:hypothetical protein
VSERRTPLLDHRPYRPDDADALSAVFAACFPRPRPPARWTWLYRDYPGQADSYVLLVDGEIAGFVGSLWFDGWLHGRPIRMNRGADFMIHPSLRGTGYYWEVTKPYTEARKHADIRFEFPTAVTRRVAAKSDYWMQHSGAVPQWWRWQTADAVHAASPRIPRVAAAPVVRVVRALAGVGASRDALVDVDESNLDRWSDAIDALVERSASFAPVVLRHDVTYARWRWFRDPAQQWTLCVLPRAGGELSGLVVFGVTPERGEIADVIAEDRKAMRTLLAGAVDRLTAAGAGAIHLLLSDPRPWSRGALHRTAFLQRGEGPVVTARVRRALNAPEAQAVGAWHLTLADYG